VPEFVAQRRAWSHRTGGSGGDGGDALRRPYVMASSWASAELVVVPLSRVPLSTFEGRDVEEAWEWVA
jgi:hypothetical protein